MHLVYQVSGLYFLSTYWTSRGDFRFLLVSAIWRCVCSACVENVLSAPSPDDQHSLSLSLCPHHTGLATWSLMRGKSSGFDVLQTCVPGPPVAPGTCNTAASQLHVTYIVMKGISFCSATNVTYKKWLCIDSLCLYASACLYVMFWAWYTVSTVN